MTKPASAHLLSLRSETHTAELMNALHDNDVTITNLPTITISTLSGSDKIAKALAKLTDFDYGIFVSRNVSPALQPLITKKLKFKKCFAVGPSTQNTIKKYIAGPIITPQNYSSEGLLALDELQDIAGRQIYIFCGNNSRPLLASLLRDRGAIVTPVICYEQSLPTYTPSLLSTLTKQHFDLIVATSTVTLENCYTLFHSQKNWLNQQHFLVINEKMAATLKRLGNQQHSIIAANPTTTAIAASIRAFIQSKKV